MAEEWSRLAPKSFQKAAGTRVARGRRARVRGVLKHALDGGGEAALVAEGAGRLGAMVEISRQGGRFFLGGREVAILASVMLGAGAQRGGGRARV